jgi:quercetin dioxygenase-like cupin family protein
MIKMTNNRRTVIQAAAATLMYGAISAFAQMKNANAATDKEAKIDVHREPIFVTPNTYQEKLSFLGGYIIVLTPPGSTDGYLVTLEGGPKGFGPPFHSHPWDEAFYVINGNVKFECNGNSAEFPPGSFVQIPANTAHTFKNTTDTMLVNITGNNSRAVEMFTAMSAQASADNDPKKILETFSKFVKLGQ